MLAAVASGARSSVCRVDAHLKLLADAGLALADAEEAGAVGESEPAAEALDRAEAALAGLRGAWAGMNAAERAIVGRAAAPLSARAERTRTRLPTRVALSEGTPERDPDEDLDPAARAA
jgi:hypothetical protein